MSTQTMKKFLVSNRNLLGAIAKWVVEQSPYHLPDNLEKVLDGVNETTKDLFVYTELGFISMTYEEIRAFVKEHLRAIPEYLAWNERKNGRQGMGISAAGHHDDGSVTFYDSKPDDDFIDLDALERNVTNEIVRNGTERGIPEILGESALSVS